MKFDDLDTRMRVYETAHDLCVLPGVHIVVRLDGRNFTTLTKQRDRFEVPFDEGFRDAMLGTVGHLMDCGFRTIYGFTESDEISILLHVEDQSFGRKIRKLDSVFAGEASAFFSRALDVHGAFDGRVCQLPSVADVIDYFRWRNEDAHRNALNAHCYWMLRGAGEEKRTATTRLSGLSVGQKNELLFQGGVNFNDLPLWQKRGMGVYWEGYDKVGENPMTGEQTVARRRRLKHDLDLPMRDAYSEWIGALLARELQAS